jgi:hypothetical protein
MNHLGIDLKKQKIAFSNRKQEGVFLKTHNFKGISVILKVKLGFCQMLNCIFKNHFFKSPFLNRTF